jgi:hypothetical protein
MRLDSAVRRSRRPWVGQPPSTSTELAPPCVALSHRPGDRGRSQSNQMRPTTGSDCAYASLSRTPFRSLCCRCPPTHWGTRASDLFEEPARVVAVRTQLRDGQVDRAHPGVEVPAAQAVAGTDAAAPILTGDGAASTQARLSRGL